ncbi:MAG: serine/threonine-protein kinase [Wenzhouxiangella sp.]|jgi:serine/threonine-protein kinase|nr:serine/threonine-protein kinase [Wenzhouxiangella sp.]
MTSGPKPDSDSDLALLERLFEQALELAPESRAAFLRERCATDSSLLDTLTRMLAYAEVSETNLAKGINTAAGGLLSPSDRSGQRIGRYLLISRIQYGGMAEVYAARRDDGEFEQDVALKIVRSDRPSELVSSLFQSERNVLARLHHPGICQIFDGGTTPEGEPYFVMERLHGDPLVESLLKPSFSWQQRIDLFLELCSALTYSHRQLVLHRDLKPQNVLLCSSQEGPQVKLLDFGISGLLLDEPTAPTMPGHRWYSQGYAAPEIMNGERGDVASDVYSLGRLLADLRVGFPGRHQAELNAIVEQAIDDDPAQRFQSVQALADELGRLREGRPLMMWSHRTTYRISRMLRRHWVWVVLGIALIGSLSAFLLREQQLRHAAERATVQAVTERDKARRISRFMTDAYRAASPAENQGDLLTVVDMLEQQLAGLLSDTAIDPTIKADLLLTLGEALLNIGRLDFSAQALDQSIELFNDTQASAANGSVFRSMIFRGQVEQRRDDFDGAEAYFRAVDEQRERWQALSEANDLEALLSSSWAVVAQRRGDLELAERLVRNGLAARAAMQGDDPSASDRASLLVTLGSIQSARSDLESALLTFEQAYDEHLTAGGQFSLSHLALLGWLGITSDRLGHSERAERYLVEAVEVAERLFPEPHPKLSGAYGNLGTFHMLNGRYISAESSMIRSLDVLQALGDSESAVYQTRLSNFARLAAYRGQLDLARSRLEQTLSLRRDLLGADHPRTMLVQTTLANIELRQGNPSRAEALASEVIARQASDEVNIDGAMARLALAMARLQQGSDENVSIMLSEVDEWMLSNPPTSARAQGELQAQRATILAGLGRSELAISALRLALDGFAEAGQFDHPVRARIQVALADLLLASGELASARELLDEAIITLNPILVPEAPLRVQIQALGQSLAVSRPALDN